MNLSVNSVESYDALSDEEKAAVVNSFVTAHNNSNLNEYGDEEVRNLITAGWSLNTPAPGAPDAPDFTYPYEEGSFFYYTGCGVCQVDTEQKGPCQQHQPQAYIKVLEAKIENLMFSL